MRPVVEVTAKVRLVLHPLEIGEGETPADAAERLMRGVLTWELGLDEPELDESAILSIETHELIS